jgi:spore germination protein KC
MKKLIVLTMVCCWIMTGCTGAKEIQNQVYITAIGLDYAKGAYKVYLQALNFSNIAKQEGGSALQQPAPVGKSEAEGRSIEAALSKLEQNAAYPLYYGHVNAIVLSKSVIENQLDSVIEFIGENPYLRYNCWLYGTEGSIKDIILGESFFNYPAIYTILHSPTPLLRENFIMPIEKYNKFISKYYQTVGSYVIPSIGIKKDYFFKNNTPRRVAGLTGGFVIAQQTFKGWASKQDLLGMKWFSKKATHIPLSLFNEKVSVMITKPKGSVKVLDGKNPGYNLKVTANAFILNNEDNLSVIKIERELSKKIKREIQTTIDKSEKMQTDLLNIAEKPYRYHQSKWKLSSLQSFDKSKIKQVSVHVHVEQNVNYKR